MDKIDSISFNAIFSDGSYKSYATLEQATVSNPVCIVKDISGTWKNGTYTNSACEFEPFDSKGNKVDSIRLGNWQLSNLKVYGDQYFNKITVHFNIIDPKGVITLKNFGSYFRGVLDAYKYLMKISRFENIENVKLSEENEKLKTQLEQLKARLDALESK